MSRLAFFVGKGGVGKTTVSSAYAVHQAFARRQSSVILISTDPAHSLGDIFQRKLGDDPQPLPIRGKHRLHVWQVNAEREFGAFLNKYKQQILSIVEGGSSIFTREDIEPLLETTLPGMAEVSALLAINHALDSGAYETLVVDTAPFGHTLRLFEMPEQFLRLLDFLEVAASRDRVLAAHFGGRTKTLAAPMLLEWQRMATAVRQTFTHEADIFLVTTPEKFALNESLRCRDILAGYSPAIGISNVVLNRVVNSGSCGTCRERRRASVAAQKVLKREFSSSRFYTAEDSGTPVFGIAGLKAFADHAFSKKPLRLGMRSPVGDAPALRRARWPVLEKHLTMVTGKGGVGKTTVSAALGWKTRSETRSAVDICSVDPAPSLDDIFLDKIDDQQRPVFGDRHFRAAEIDSARLFKNWAGEMKQLLEDSLSSERGQVHVDLWFERELFSKLLDIVPPGVDEVFAVFRILDLLARKSNRVAIDMAPTGHELVMLRTPQRLLAWTRLLLKTLAEHRTLAFVQEAAVKVAELGQRVRELNDLLRKAETTRIYLVMVPESLPDRETERLQNDLRALGLPLGGVFVNRVLFAEDTQGCSRCRRARQWQLATLSKWRKRALGGDVFVLREFGEEIAGKRALQKFTRELWRLE